MLATGLGGLSEGSANGEVINRTLGFMHVQRASEPLPATVDGRIWLDGVTAGLVNPRFVVQRTGPGLFELHGERDCIDSVRPLAGRLTPCVGRERELATLTALLAECIDEPMARVALVVAPPGRGKSRLRHELLARLRTAQPKLTVLTGYVEPLSAGVSGALLAQCLRRLGGVRSEDTAEVAQAKLELLLQKVLPAEQLERCLVPLGALGSQPLGQDGTAAAPPALGALRAQLEPAFVQLMLALAKTNPLLVVLEDLQWADALSVRVWHRVLSELAEQPLLVVALARPEIHAIFPRLWAEHRVQELRLEPLLPSACEQLVETVLGPGSPAAPHILEHSRGTPLFLEELIILAAQDPAARNFPATLIALEQGRLLRLPAHALRVLRAASGCGMTFWEEGIYLLLATVMPAEHIASGLQALLAGELIFRQRQSRFPHTTEYRFRQPLTLAAATQLLNETDRELARAVMARYL